MKELLSSLFGWWAVSKRDTEYSFSLFPNPREYSRAVADLVSSLGWRQFAVIYEEEEALSTRLTGVLGLQGAKDKKDVYGEATGVVAFKLPEGDRPARFLFKELRRARGRLTRFVVDCAADSVARVLRRMRDANLTSEYAAVVFTSPDFHLANFSALSAMEGMEANVTGFRMVDTGSAAVMQYLRDWEDEEMGRGVVTSANTDQYESLEDHPLSVSYMTTVLKMHLKNTLFFNSCVMRFCMTLCVCTRQPWITSPGSTRASGSTGCRA